MKAALSIENTYIFCRISLQHKTISLYLGKVLKKASLGKLSQFLEKKRFSLDLPLT